VGEASKDVTARNGGEAANPEGDWLKACSENIDLHYPYTVWNAKEIGTLQPVRQGGDAP